MKYINIDTYIAHLLMELAKKHIEILSRLKTEAIDEVASLIHYNNGGEWQDVPSGRANLIKFIIKNIDKE